MKKVYLWEDPCWYQDEEGVCLLVEPDDIVQKIDLSFEHVYMFPELEPTEENEIFLNSLLPKLKECKDYYEIIDLPELTGITVEQAGDNEEAKHILCYFEESENIGYLDECESIPVYVYWDGSNWKEKWQDPSITETEIVYDETKEENLDEWDGNNWIYKRRFNHGRKYPIIEINGEKVKNKYLIIEWSQYQGSLPKGKIVEE